MLEAYLRSADSKARPLRETAGLADAAQHVGGAGNGLFTYQNQREVMRESSHRFEKQFHGQPGIRRRQCVQRPAFCLAGKNLQ